jgi:hypothetical protein
MIDAENWNPKGWVWTVLAASVVKNVNQLYFCEISGSHGSEYEDNCLLEYCAV